MKQVKKILKGVLIVLLSLLVLFVSVRVFVVLTGQQKIRTVEELSKGAEKKDAVLVLGAGVYRDGSLSPMLKIRLDTTIDVYESKAVDYVFVTGDHRALEYDEVDHMIDYLVENGIPKEKILFDYNGYSTYESIYRAAYKYDIKSAVIVTQKYHLYRALFIGKQVGMEVSGVDAVYKGSLEGDGYRLMREWAATLKDVWNCLLQKEVSLEEAS